MSILTVTTKGQVTLRKDVLQHLGVVPGEKIAVEKLPDGRVEVRAGTEDRQDLGCLRFPEKRAGAFPVDRGNK